MFRNFGEYMFSLLSAPLKRGKRSVNQFFIFFKVIGRIFDGMKTDVFRVRDEANIASASPIMLSVHGQDRDMPRLNGESIENYRTRLVMKGIIAQEAGTNKGIRYLARAFGYDSVEIEPAPKPERWAEATVRFVGGRIVLDDEALLLQELNKIKPARTLLSVAKEQRYSGTLYIGSAYIIGKQITISQG